MQFLNSLALHPALASLAGMVTHSQRTNPVDNDAATADTVKLMAQIAMQQCQSPIVQRLVQDLQLRELPLLDRLQVVFNWVKTNVRYVEDDEILDSVGYHRNPFGTELLQYPDYLLSQTDRKGDCDCISLLTITLLMCAGTPNVSLVTIKDVPEMWTHIYCCVGLDGDRRVNLDCSHGHYCGWELDDHFVYARRFWRVN